MKNLIKKILKESTETIGLEPIVQTYLKPRYHIINITGSNGEVLKTYFFDKKDRSLDIHVHEKTPRDLGFEVSILNYNVDITKAIENVSAKIGHNIPLDREKVANRIVDFYIDNELRSDLEQMFPEIPNVYLEDRDRYDSEIRHIIKKKVLMNKDFKLLRDEIGLFGDTCMIWD